MKRKWAWLALTLFLVLCAALWGVKWRGDYPTPTKEDLAIRALISQCTRGSISIHNGFLDFSGKDLNPTELRTLSQSFHINRNGNFSSRAWVAIEMHKVSSGSRKDKNLKVVIDIAEKEGYISGYSGVPYDGVFNLHPITVKAWSNFLLNHPTIGPQIRKRLKR